MHGPSPKSRPLWKEGPPARAALFSGCLQRPPHGRMMMQVGPSTPVCHRVLTRGLRERPPAPVRKQAYRQSPWAQPHRPRKAMLFLFSLLGCLIFATPWSVVHQAPLSMGFSRQEYLSGLPFLSPGDLPNQGLKCIFCISCIGRWTLHH